MAESLALADLTGEKEFQPDALKRTVQEQPPTGWPTFADGLATFFLAGAYVDEIEPWGRVTKLRDAQLREFVTHESYFASALGIVGVRNAAFSWEIKGKDETEMERLAGVCQNANFGLGWENLIEKTTTDLSTQDAGAFWEVIREKDSADAPLAGLANLDAARCYHTGHPDVPVIYQDRLGQYHQLKWYQVCTFSEMPTAVEGLYGLQYCTLTRLLRDARRLRDQAIYLSEKIGGRMQRAITLLKGVTAEQVEEQLQKANVQMDGQGLRRYARPLFVSTLDPKADVGFETFEMASIPDGFDLDVSVKTYIGLLAMAFLTDYQEFAPLPGGNLGTSNQSEILHQKSRGKGPGLFMKMIVHAMNWNILPDGYEFGFDEQDLDEDQQNAVIKQVRANARSLRIASTELTPEMARQVALEEGDLTQEQYDELVKQADDLKKQQEAQQQAQLDALAQGQQPPPGGGPPKPGQPKQGPPDTQPPQQKNSNEAAGGAQNANQQPQKDSQAKKSKKRKAAEPGPARLRVETLVADKLEGVFEELYQELTGALAPTAD